MQNVTDNKVFMDSIMWEYQLVFLKDYFVNNGLSVVAVDPTKNGKAVGMFSSMDEASINWSFGLMCAAMGVSNKIYGNNPRQAEFDQVVMAANTELGKEMDFLQKKYKLKSKEKLVCEMASLGVHPDYQGKGIAKVLTRLLIENSKK